MNVTTFAYSTDGNNFEDHHTYNNEKEISFSDNKFIVNCPNCSLFRIKGGYLSLKISTQNKTSILKIYEPKTIDAYTLSFDLPKVIDLNEYINLEEISGWLNLIFEYCYDSYKGDSVTLVFFEGVNCCFYYE